MTRSLAGVERPNVCNRLDSLLLILCYAMLKAKKKNKTQNLTPLGNWQQLAGIIQFMWL